MSLGQMRTAYTLGSVVFALIMLELAFNGNQARACVCVSENDPARERQQQMVRSDLVFVGAVRKIASRPRLGWNCDFDEIFQERADKNGCVLVRVTEGFCGPIKNAKVGIRKTDGSKKEAVYTAEDGTGIFCRLAPGEYEVSASTSQEKKGATVHVTEAQGAKLQLSLDIQEPRLFRTEFIVETVIKGVAPRTVVVETSDNDGSCGFGSFNVGQRYEVFARKRGGSYTVDLCSGTHPLSERAGMKK